MGDRLLLGVTHPMTAKVLLRGQLAALRDAGFDVGLVVGTEGDLGEEAESAGITVFRIPMARRSKPLADLRSLAAMRAVVHRFQPSILSAGTPKAGLIGMLAGLEGRTPARVYVMRGLPLETARGARKMVLLTAEKIAAGCAHKVICVSESLRRRVEDLGIAHPEKVAVLGPGSSNGVDEKRFRPADRDQQQDARRTFSIPSDAPVIGFVGRLTGDKGLADLSEIFFESILPQSSESRLLLVGDFEPGDPVPAEVRRKLTEHSQVHVVGFTDSPELAYSAMDVLAFPSYREGFPNAPLEAASSAVPVAGYASTGTVDAVVDRRTGTLTKVGDRGALSAAILSYLGDPELRRGQGSVARERVVREFRPELIWRHWVDFYRLLLMERQDSAR